MTTASYTPSPELFFETLNAHQRSAALKAAIELKLFTAIGHEELPASDIASKCDSSEKGIRVLCDYLTILGFLTKKDFRYKLTRDSALFLDSSSPAYVGQAMDFLFSPDLLAAFADLKTAVRKGGTALPQGGTVAPEHPIWAQFAKAMAPLAAFSAQAIAALIASDGLSTNKVLDIAAGHGLYGIIIAQNNPKAQIFPVDWPHVLEVAKENARSAGVQDRYSVIPGSAFDVDFGKGYDLILLTNFLHHFDVPTCEGLLRKIRPALSPGGKVITLEFVPNEDRISPPLPAAFALTMLGSTSSGDAYTFSELDRMFRNAGFANNVIRPIPPVVQQVILSSE